MLNAERIRSLLTEAREDLKKYDALRANSLEMIAAYERRLELLGIQSEVMPLPGVEQPMPQLNGNPPHPPSNKDLFEIVVNGSSTPLKADAIWSQAERMGAKSQSLNPVRTADSVLREMVTQGRIALVGKALYGKKEAQAAT